MVPLESILVVKSVMGVEEVESHFVNNSQVLVDGVYTTLILAQEVFEVEVQREVGSIITFVVVAEAPPVEAPPEIPPKNLTNLTVLFVASAIPFANKIA